jgi:hypothetical protein
MSDEARALCYKIGIKELEPFIRRTLALEAKVAEQATQIQALQTTVLQLKHGRETVAG